MMKEKFGNSYLFGGNAPFVEELYEAWLEDAASVPESWNQYFSDLARQPGAVARDVAHAPVIAAFEALVKTVASVRPRLVRVAMYRRAWRLSS